MNHSTKVVIAAGAGAFIAAKGFTIAGFTSSGIAAGSKVAAIQSSIGSVTSGSAFATLQSLGATGTIATVGTVGLAVGGVVGVGYAGYKLHKSGKLAPVYKLISKPKLWWVIDSSSIIILFSYLHINRVFESLNSGEN